jgi:leader peptidase (prepilin peptidase)/N-methyltransferase
MRGREGLGQGDAKLLAAAGAWLGWEALPVVVFIGAVLGLALVLLRRRPGQKLDAATALPFGAPLALATWVMWLAASYSP